MSVVSGDDYTPELWPRYEAIIRAAEPGFAGFEMLERFEFYRRTAQAYAVVATGESGRYANIILKKGISDGESSDQSANLKLPIMKMYLFFCLSRRGDGRTALRIRHLRHFRGPSNSCSRPKSST